MGFKEIIRVTIETLYFTTYGYILIKLTALCYILYENGHFYIKAWFKLIKFGDKHFFIYMLYQLIKY